MQDNNLSLRPGGDGARTPVMGFEVDVVGFGRRPELARDDIEQRLPALMLAVLDHGDLRAAVVKYTGDGMRVLLPPNTDPAHALTAVLTATWTGLTRDNARFQDRMRLRMVLDFGLARHTRYGPTGNLTTDLSRLIDSATIRAAVTEHADWDLVALISNRLCELVKPERLRLKQVEVAAKEYSASAWLWLPGGEG